MFKNVFFIPRIFISVFMYIFYVRRVTFNASRYGRRGEGKVIECDKRVLYLPLHMKYLFISRSVSQSFYLLLDSGYVL